MIRRDLSMSLSDLGLVLLYKSTALCDFCFPCPPGLFSCVTAISRRRRARCCTG
ncbi:hypothetical protein K438DRAFT_1875838 [Mycena galopus ATCC 62051]|nr:hypothetical protein K438DRAFT_1875838 [Mycena galopus ATCC 62051]